jgi:DNA repair photolyase
MSIPGRGRGAGFSPDNRYSDWRRERLDDGWGLAPEHHPDITSLTPDQSRSVIAWNRSPDIPFDRSVNPYRGCEHGCIYCYARPSHAWLGLSPGLPFESQLFYKPEAAKLLRRELQKPGYLCRPLALSGNTDPYQPLERRLGITRDILAVLLEYRHPVTIVTKSALPERDLDLLLALAERNLVRVNLSLTTLDGELARRLEPRAPTPQRRLASMAALAERGVPVGVVLAPVIPALTDADMERVLQGARDAGAAWARYILVRLPLEVEPLFRDWLERHVPERAQRVWNQIRNCHGGRSYDPRYGRRMSGSGPVAELIAGRFRLAVRRLGYGEAPQPDCTHFRIPGAPRQLDLFD